MAKVAEEEDLVQVKSRDEQGKRHPLPERIAQLPKDDPERMRFEKGWKAKKINYYDPLEEKARAHEKLDARGAMKGLWTLVLIFALLGGMVYGAFLYMDRVFVLREEIVWVVKSKGYQVTDAPVMEVVVLSSTFRLGVLEEALRRLKRLPDKPDPDKVREEMTSYLDYIRKNNKPFIPVEAIKWLAESYRYP